MIKNNKLIYLILSILIIYSCVQKQKIDTENYPSGNLKLAVYSKSDQEIDSILYYYDSVKTVINKKAIRYNNHDSIIIYYKNGNVFNTGKKTFDRLKFGNWIRCVTITLANPFGYLWMHHC